MPCTSATDRSQEPSSRQALSPSASVPVSFGSSPITTSIAAPARNPVITAFDRNCAIQPRRKIASARNSRPVTRAIAATSAAASAAREPGGEDRAAGDRGERRARPGGDLPRGGEQRVDDRARGRGVEAVLQRHAGDPGVAEVLGHDQRGHRDRRHQVPAQPDPLVPRQPVGGGDGERQSAHRVDGAVMARTLRAAGRRGHHPNRARSAGYLMRRLLGAEHALERGVDLGAVADDLRGRVGALERDELGGVGVVEHLVGLPADRRRRLVGVAAGVAQLERLAVGGGDPDRPDGSAGVGLERDLPGVLAVVA